MTQGIGGSIIGGDKLPLKMNEAIALTSRKIGDVLCDKIIQIAQCFTQTVKTSALTPSIGWRHWLVQGSKKDGPFLL